MQFLSKIAAVVFEEILRVDPKTYMKMQNSQNNLGKEQSQRTYISQFQNLPQNDSNKDRLID